MKRKKKEEHENVDRWVVSYADFITLLFAFFTVMYAVSHVDTGKLERFTGSVRSAFKAKTAGGKTIIEGVKPITYADVELEKDVKAEFEKFDDMEGVVISREDRGVLISFGDAILFESGLVDIKDGAKPLLSSAASVIKKTQNKIVIEGHTDNVPVGKSIYRSNWELSTARATSTLMYLLKEYNSSPERFSAAGYGEYKPVVSNATAEGRARNRRIDILFLSRSD
jgi:chemotaxis protein MotB